MRPLSSRSVIANILIPAAYATVSGIGPRIPETLNLRFRV